MILNKFYQFCPCSTHIAGCIPQPPPLPQPHISARLITGQRAPMAATPSFRTLIAIELSLTIRWSSQLSSRRDSASWRSCSWSWSLCCPQVTP